MPVENVKSRSDRSPLYEQFSTWIQGIDFELEFWNNFLLSGGGEWPEDFQLRLDPERSLDDWMLRDMILDEGYTLKILDVGAGPLTVLGKRHNNQKIDIIATDPLAPFYSEIIDRLAIARPIETVQAFAEDLSAYFEQSSFDITHCCNALDHSFDPMRGIEEMLAVTRVGGRLVLRHNINEAEMENYSGFHQWNFIIEEGNFIIWNKDSRINVSERVKEYATVKIVVSDIHCVVFIIKNREIDKNYIMQARERLRDVYSAALLSLLSLNGRKIINEN